MLRISSLIVTGAVAMVTFKICHSATNNSSEFQLKGYLSEHMMVLEHFEVWAANYVLFSVGGSSTWQSWFITNFQVFWYSISYVFLCKHENTICSPAKDWKNFLKGVEPEPKLELDSSEDNIAMTNQSKPKISLENSHSSTLITLIFFDTTGVNNPDRLVHVHSSWQCVTTHFWGISSERGSCKIWAGPALDILNEVQKQKRFVLEGFHKSTFSSPPQSICSQYLMGTSSTQSLFINLLLSGFFP